MFYSKGDHTASDQGHSIKQRKGYFYRFLKNGRAKIELHEMVFPRTQSKTGLCKRIHMRTRLSHGLKSSFFENYIIKINEECCF